MENKIWQPLVKKWSALTGKIPLPAQIASLLSLVLVSVFVVFIVLWVAKLSGVSESFLRLLGILLSPTVIICALVLYLWRRHERQIRKILKWITKLRPYNLALISPDSKLDNKSKASPSDTATSSGSLDNSDTATSSGSNFNEIEKKAKQGDAEAQFNLGVLYDIGKGVEQNHTKAAHWYQRAANQEHATARFNLGVSYYNGEGVKQNHTKAANFFRLAAEQGHAKAQFNLGALYYKGEGVAQNYTAAANWYRRAAKQGVAKAQFNLGALYHNGEGVAQNYSEAYIWFSLASAGNYPNAREARDQVAKKLDADSMKNAQSETARREEEIRHKRKSKSR